MVSPSPTPGLQPEVQPLRVHRLFQVKVRLKVRKSWAERNGKYLTVLHRYPVRSRIYRPVVKYVLVRIQLSTICEDLERSQIIATPPNSGEASPGRTAADR
jgi:hypothetical protein